MQGRDRGGAVTSSCDHCGHLWPSDSSSGESWGNPGESERVNRYSSCPGFLWPLYPAPANPGGSSRNVFFRRPHVQSPASTGPCSHWSVQRVLVCGRSQHLWCSSTKDTSDLPLYHMASPCASPCFIRPPVIGFRALPNPVRPCLNLMTSAKTPFPHSQALRLKDWAYLLGRGTQVNPHSSY